MAFYHVLSKLKDFSAKLFWFQNLFVFLQQVSPMLRKRAG